MKPLLLLFVLATFGAGCALPGTLPPVPAPRAPIATPSLPPPPPPATVTASSTPVAPQVLQTTTKTLTANGDGYTANVTYPELQNGDAQIVDAFNLTVASSAHALLNDFLNDTKGITPQLMSMSAGFPWTLDLNARVVSHAPGLIVVYGSGSIYTGGAHPNEIYLLVLFDTKQHKEIQPQDLFTDPSASLPHLSTYAIAQLKTKLTDLGTDGASWIESGAKADWTNYQLLYPTADGVTVVFTPYQVAPYAAGPQTIHLPNAEIGSELVQHTPKVMTDAAPTTP